MTSKRRPFRGSAVCSVLVLAWWGVAGLLARAGTLPPPGLTIQGGALVKDGHPYRGIGANYYDLFLRVLDQPTNTSSLRGLEKLSRAGIPFVRFATMYSAEHLRFFYEHPREYLRRFDRVVRAAEKSQMGLIPSFNWTLAISEVAAEPRDQWGNVESRTIRLMRQYVGEIVARYQDSPAIWAWEFGNEPNLSADLPNAAQFRPKGGTERDDLRSNQIQVAVDEFAREVRRHDHTRPIFSGNSHPRAAAWHNTRENTWTADSREQFQEILLRDNPVSLGTICVHLYGNTPQKELAGWAATRAEWLTTVRAIARANRCPLFVGEFGLPGIADQTAIRATFKELLAEMSQAEVDLAAFWVYDFSDQRDDWNVDLENPRAYMLQLTAEANRRWNREALEKR